MIKCLGTVEFSAPKQAIVPTHLRRVHPSISLGWHGHLRVRAGFRSGAENAAHESHGEMQNVWQLEIILEQFHNGA